MWVEEEKSQQKMQRNLQYRYEASLTVDDLAEQTRIPQRHLLALEARVR